MISVKQYQNYLIELVIFLKKLKKLKKIWVVINPVLLNLLN